MIGHEKFLCFVLVQRQFSKQSEVNDKECLLRQGVLKGKTLPEGKKKVIDNCTSNVSCHVGSLTYHNKVEMPFFFKSGEDFIQ